MKIRILQNVSYILVVLLAGLGMVARHWSGIRNDAPRAVVSVEKNQRCNQKELTHENHLSNHRPPVSAGRSRTRSLQISPIRRGSGNIPRQLQNLKESLDEGFSIKLVEVVSEVSFDLDCDGAK